MTQAHACTEEVYGKWLLADAAAIRRRALKDKLERNRELREPVAGGQRLAKHIDSMLRAMSESEPATLEDISARVVGMTPDCGKKNMQALLKRGLVVHVGFSRTASGQRPKTWLRVAK